MSHVSNVLLTCRVYDPGISAVQDWLKDNRHLRLAEFQDYAASEKRMEVFVYGGGFNMLNINEFLRAVRAAPWRDPNCVQVFIRDEHEDIFTERLIPRIPGPIYASPPKFEFNEEQRKRYQQAIKDGLI